MCSIGLFSFCIVSPWQWKVFFFSFFFQMSLKILHWWSIRSRSTLLHEMVDAVRIQNPWRHKASIDPNMSKLVIDNIATQGTRASAAILFTYFSHKIFQQQNICNPYMPTWHEELKLLHDDVIKRKLFLHYWPFVRGIHRSPVNSRHKGQWRGALMCSLICACINGSVNNGEAGNLTYHCAHYDVTVMDFLIQFWLSPYSLPSG